MHTQGFVGNCCGTLAICGFNRSPSIRSQNFLKKTIEENSQTKIYGKLLVATLTQRQHKWFPILKKHGFKVRDTWKNINSGSKIYLFTLNTGKDFNEKETN